MDTWLIICTSCKESRTGTRSGSDLIRRLQDALDAAGFGDVTATGVACMAGCKRPCAVSVQGRGKASYLFGDLGVEDIPDLVRFAARYRDLPDGWCSSTERPGKLRRSTLARLPAVTGPE